MKLPLCDLCLAGNEPTMSYGIWRTGYKNGTKVDLCIDHKGSLRLSTREDFVQIYNEAAIAAESMLRLAKLCRTAAATIARDDEAAKVRRSEAAAFVEANRVAGEAAAAAAGTTVEEAAGSFPLSNR